MIESISSRTQGIHISHMVAHPKGKTVPLRIMNTSLDPIELTSGRKVAQFHQLLTSKGGGGQEGVSCQEITMVF